ncbi:MAG: LamG domain-containing protein [Candidatus Poribacteria bacterium]|nr:LamG domain-containing protein [Candidatus Poribacteria bacterium]
MKILTISLLSICLIVVLGTVGEAVREDDLALYLSFDEAKGDTAKDKSKHKNDGTIHKGKRVKGKIGQAVELTGEAGGWVEVPDSKSLDIRDEITLMCWVYPTEFTNEWFRIIVKTWAGDTAPWMVYGFYEQGGSNGKTGFIISVDNGTEKRCGNGPSPQLPAEEWTHLAATYDGSEMRLYYDGELAVEQKAKGKIDDNDVPVSVGRNSEGNREHYIGRIDEVAIWSVALDEGEINEAMDRVFAVEPEGKLPTRWGRVKDKYYRMPKSFTLRDPWQ